MDEDIFFLRVRLFQAFWRSVCEGRPVSKIMFGTRVALLSNVFFSFLFAVFNAVWNVGVNSGPYLDPVDPLQIGLLDPDP